jgi:hypothetical protein
MCARRVDHMGATSFAIGRRPFIEDGAQSLAIESETESVFLCKLADLCFPIFLVRRPQPLQVLLVNRAVLPLAMHLAFDLSRERFHRFHLSFGLTAPNPRGTRNHPHEDAFNSGLASGDSGLQLNLAALYPRGVCLEAVLYMYSQHLTIIRRHLAIYLLLHRGSHR